MSLFRKIFDVYYNYRFTLNIVNWLPNANNQPTERRKKRSKDTILFMNFDKHDVLIYAVRYYLYMDFHVVISLWWMVKQFNIDCLPFYKNWLWNKKLNFWFWIFLEFKSQLVIFCRMSMKGIRLTNKPHLLLLSLI